MCADERTKIAFVCQRYGAEVNGGAEQYCRAVAEHLATTYDVTVYTTCALEYTTWKNHYAPGTEELNGVHVKRYLVSRERKGLEFSLLSKRVFVDRRHRDALEEKWVDAQGPYSPDALDALKREHGQYVVVFFMTYLYYLTVRGLGLGFSNAALIPTVHDEPPVYLRCYDKVFAQARAIAWNTPEERAFALRRFPFISRTPSEMTGIGIDLPQTEGSELPESLEDGEYLVYAGRIDKSKGCQEMFTFFQRYKREYGGRLKLALMGKPVLTIPDDPDIVYLGFVSEEEKQAVLSHSLALVLFSHFESLSIVVLESMIAERPVLVSGKCDVLKGHCIRSNAGLYFDSYPEFALSLRYLKTHPTEYQAMCHNGRRYVEENYRWDVIVQKYARLIDLFA